MEDIFTHLLQRNNISIDKFIEIDNIFELQRISGRLESYRDYIKYKILPHENTKSIDYFTLQVQNNQQELLRKIQQVKAVTMGNKIPQIIFGMTKLHTSVGLSWQDIYTLLEKDMSSDIETIFPAQRISTDFNYSLVNNIPDATSFLKDYLETLSKPHNDKVKYESEIDRVWVSPEFNDLALHQNHEANDLLIEFLEDHVGDQEFIYLDPNDNSYNYVLHDGRRINLHDIANVYSYEPQDFEFHDVNFFETDFGDKGYELQERITPLIIDGRIQGAALVSVGKTDFDDPHILINRPGEYFSRIANKYGEPIEGRLDYPRSFRDYYKRYNGLVILESVGDRLE